MQHKAIHIITAGASQPTAMPFSISVAKAGIRAEIRIIGTIGWEVNSEEFRRDVAALVDEGIKSVHVYIHSPGGNCFDACEIVNILNTSFKGNVTGEGGALVASAATYIALQCKEFTMPANGQFMIHKPSAWVGGTSEQIENTLKSLKDTESDYYNTYKAVATDAAEFEKRWNSGDWWLTAKEAKEMGFITDVKAKVKIDKETAALAKACGCPVAFTPDNSTKEPKIDKMELEQIAKALGLPATATVAEIVAKITENQTNATALATANSQLQEAQVTALVDANVGKKFTAENRQKFIDLGKSAGLAVLKTTIEAIPDMVKPSGLINPNSGAQTDKTWDKLTEAEVKDLRENNKEEYIRLFAAYYGHMPELK